MKKSILILFVFFAMFHLSAQSAEFVSEILGVKEITREQVSYLPAVWLEAQNESMTYEQAANFLIEKGILVTKGDLKAPVTMAEFAGICMRTWKIPGGLFYTLTKSNRYAFKELKAYDLITESADPSFHLSGSVALELMHKCMEFNEDKELKQ